LCCDGDDDDKVRDEDEDDACAAAHSSISSAGAAAARSRTSVATAAAIASAFDAMRRARRRDHVRRMGAHSSVCAAEGAVKAWDEEEGEDEDEDEAVASRDEGCGADDETEGDADVGVDGGKSEVDGEDDDKADAEVDEDLDGNVCEETLDDDALIDDAPVAAAADGDGFLEGASAFVMKSNVNNDSVRCGKRTPAAAADTDGDAEACKEKLAVLAFLEDAVEDDRGSGGGGGETGRPFSAKKSRANRSVCASASAAPMRENASTDDGVTCSAAAARLCRSDCGRGCGATVDTAGIVAVVAVGAVGADRVLPPVRSPSLRLLLSAELSGWRLMAVALSVAAAAAVAAVAISLPAALTAAR
jgi:hypothetical protein